MSKYNLPPIYPLRPFFTTKNHPTLLRFLAMLLPCKTRRPWFHEFFPPNLFLFFYLQIFWFHEIFIKNSALKEQLIHQLGQQPNSIMVTTKEVDLVDDENCKQTAEIKDPLGNNSHAVSVISGSSPEKKVIGKKHKYIHYRIIAKTTRTCTKFSN